MHYRLTLSRLRLIPAVRQSPPMLFLTKLTDVNLVSYIGESVDARSFQFRVMGAVANSCSKHPSHGRYLAMV